MSPRTPEIFTSQRPLARNGLRSSASEAGTPPANRTLCVYEWLPAWRPRYPQEEHDERSPRSDNGFANACCIAVGDCSSADSAEPQCSSADPTQPKCPGP